ncbi:RelA/SpoT domain-containing protein [Shewanella rhizosphaerae]|uniref:RelA/SpoT domain-containing protein n=1 Tax=Shewanella rhizosphaerae TaxID=2864207 RepID=UPI001C654FF6|nr:RelA/SpoT domain-containing protein [Shewanella rhizosphaerae]QYK12120.1 RelA/SpoT domain-containing protein [Shewanella rhizosphaerae]
MNKLFRPFFIFLLLVSTRSALATNYDALIDTKEESGCYAQKQSFSKDQHGLHAIASSSAALIRQSSDDLDSLYAQAQNAQQELTSLLEGLNTQESYQLLIPEVKSYERAKAKIAAKFDGDASRITDLARASLVANDIQGLMTAFEDLQQQVKVLQVKNRFAEPKASGYRDLNLLVQLPQTGMIAEVQLHLKAIAEIKSGEEHKAYEQIQAIEARAIAQSRDLSQLELAQITHLRQASHKQYHKAWLYYKRLDSAELLAAAA